MNNYRIAIWIACIVGLLFAYGLYQMPKQGGAGTAPAGTGQGSKK